VTSGLNPGAGIEAGNKKTFTNSASASP